MLDQAISAHSYCLYKNPFFCALDWQIRKKAAYKRNALFKLCALEERQQCYDEYQKRDQAQSLKPLRDIVLKTLITS